MIKGQLSYSFPTAGLVKLKLLSPLQAKGIARIGQRGEGHRSGEVSAQKMLIFAPGTHKGGISLSKSNLSVFPRLNCETFLKSIKSLFMAGMFEIQKINAIRNATMF